MVFLNGFSSPMAGPHALENQNSMGKCGIEEMFLSPGLSSTSVSPAFHVILDRFV